MHSVYNQQFAVEAASMGYQYQTMSFYHEQSRLEDHSPKQYERSMNQTYEHCEFPCFTRQSINSNLTEQSTELATQHHSFCKAEILSKEEFEQSSLETEKYENSHVELPAPCIDSSTSLKNQLEYKKIIKQEDEVEEPKRKRSEKGQTQRSNKKGNGEKSKQSISKNNIRNFLTPVIRMKQGFFYPELLKQEGVSLLDYETFLKEHFYHMHTTRLNIRQTTLNALMSIESEEQLLQKKVFAITVSRLMSVQFIKLISEKGSQFSNHEIKQQFEWINGVNTTLVEFLNSLEE